jgi:hypothetical protein
MTNVEFKEEEILTQFKQLCEDIAVDSRDVFIEKCLKFKIDTDWTNIGRDYKLDLRYFKHDNYQYVSNALRYVQKNSDKSYSVNFSVYNSVHEIGFPHSIYVEALGGIIYLSLVKYDHLVELDTHTNVCEEDNTPSKCTHTITNSKGHKFTKLSVVTDNGDGTIVCYYCLQEFLNKSQNLIKDEKVS